jgi:Tyrosine phosphatase family
MSEGRRTLLLRAASPWLLILILVGVAVWHVLDFSEPRDTEFPRVVRPFFNPLPPAAYRLAEPGDTLDRIGLYFASAATMLALVGVVSRLGAKRQNEPNGVAFWPTALALGVAATWHASTPGPTFDGWHGLGWRAIFNPEAPTATRVALGLWASSLLAVILLNLAESWPGRRGWLRQAGDMRIQGLLATAAILVALRQFDLPGVEPVGYWPRCSFDVGMLAFTLALIRARPLAGCRLRSWPTIGFVLGWAFLLVAGIGLTIYHRPLPRLRAVVPGKIYISAMPSYGRLAIEQERLHFKTIINLFDEASTQASVYHDDEIRFVREHGLRYLGSPSDGLESDRFLDETLALAQDPEAWPILVHCHGCMDRSPAWMGIYRFLVEGKSLDAVFREIERHRGSRPKAVVTLQYNRKLPARAPDRFAADPSGPLLSRCVAGTKDPFLRPNWNQTATSRRVVTRIEPDPAIRRP